jgi:hypothetical protein
MALRRISRDAATSNGLLKRVDDLALDQVSDPRDKRWIQFDLFPLLRLMILGLLSGARSMRAVEDRSETAKSSEAFDLDDRRVADNTLGRLLQRLSPVELGAALRRGVMAAWRRKGLLATRLPWNVVAIDGKHIGTVPESRVRKVLMNPGEEGLRLSTAELKRRCKDRFPGMQLQDGAGGVVGLMRIHNATLISSDAAVVIHQRPVAGKSNEIGEMPKLLRELFQYYGRTKMLQVLTLDAGNTSRRVCACIVGRGAHYVGRSESNLGHIHFDAERTLGSRGDDAADVRYTTKVNGCSLEYVVWTEPLPDGVLAWNHVRQRVRIERRCTRLSDQTVTVGTRYVVTSMTEQEATARQILDVLIAHWRIENETHWPADAQWDEDARRTPWTQHPVGLLVTAAMRAAAMNILAVMRAMCRRTDNPDRSAKDARWYKPTWLDVRQTVFSVCFNPPTETTEFDRVTTC